MSKSLIYNNYVESIVAGQAESSDISAEECSNITSLEKQSLLNLLALTKADALSTTSALNEFRGEAEGENLEIPAFLYGEIQVLDTDNTAQVDEAGTTQYVTDSDGSAIAETGGKFTWSPVEKRHHKARTLTVPAGVKVRFLFVLA